MIPVKWSINNKCNLRCPFCFIEDTKDIKTLPFRDLCKVLTKFSEMGISEIDFFGKEVLYDETIFKLMRYSNSINYFPTFTMITNGVNLGKFKNEIFNSPLERITVSYDVINHRTFRVSDDTLEQFSAEFPIELAIDIHEDSVDALIKSLSRFVSIGIDSIDLNPIMPIGSLASNVNPISESNYSNLINKLQEIENKPYTSVKVPFNFKGLTKKFEKGLNLDNFCVYTEPKCTSGLDHFYVDSSGIAYGCVSAAGVCNNQYTCDFLNTPNNEVFKKIRNVSGRRLCVK